MEIQNQNRRHTIRNIYIFTISIIILGWLGWLLNYLGGDKSSQDIGQLIWLISPLVVSFVLRIFVGDGWKDLGIKPNFRGNGLWYAVSILVYPFCIIIVLVIGSFFGSISFPGFSSKGVAVFSQAIIIAVATNFFKNIFEEFGWRGYITPKLFSLKLNDMVCHIIVGIIWAVWHLPYYLGFLDSSVLQNYTSLNLATFIPLVFIGLIAASILYGEIRVLTNSVWPAVLLHSIGNAFILTLLMQDFIEIPSNTHFLFTPSHEGILTIILFTLIGIIIYRKRRKMTQNTRSNLIKPWISILFIILGIVLFIFGGMLVLTFYSFPIIPQIMVVTLWSAVITFSIVAIIGLAILTLGIINLIRFKRQSS